jgi:GTP 3',8-cyclase
MLDQYNRKVNYLRISVTDRCNLRCLYCMPAEGVQCLSDKELLSYDEILRIIKAAAKLGITKIRFTGGEPLLRKDIVELVMAAKKAEGIREVCITTNGVLLSSFSKGLAEAGIDNINISIDSLDSVKYGNITGGGRLENILEGIRLSLGFGIKRIAVNTVVLKGKNDDEIINFVRFSEVEGIDVRFIELMPLGEGQNHPFLSNDAVKSVVLSQRELRLDSKQNQASSHVQYYKTKDDRGVIGFISPMTHNFCGHCNKIRLTAGGFLKQCLHWDRGIDLKAVLRDCKEDKEIEQAIRHMIYGKPLKHSFNDEFDKGDRRRMSQIGG